MTLAGVPGFKAGHAITLYARENMANGVYDNKLADDDTVAHPRNANGPKGTDLRDTSKPGTRLELVTPSLPWKCSTN